MDRWELMGVAGSSEEEKRGGVYTIGGKRGTGRENDETQEGYGGGWVSAKGDRESGRGGGRQVSECKR